MDKGKNPEQLTTRQELASLIISHKDAIIKESEMYKELAQIIYTSARKEIIKATSTLHDKAVALKMIFESNHPEFIDNIVFQSVFYDIAVETIVSIDLKFK